MLRTRPGSARPLQTALPEELRNLVLAELELILESPAFRASKRCQQFLRYTVEHALAGETDLLKERSIGIAVFSRPPDYDTGGDAIVRVAAKEVRDRIVTYYGALTSEPPVRFKIAPGSYIPEFQWTDPLPQEVVQTPHPGLDPPRRSLLYPALAIAAAALAICGIVVILQFYSSRSNAGLLRRFWEPTFSGSRPVIICLASPLVYHLDDEVYRRFGARDPGDPGIRTLNPPDDAIIYGREVIPSRSEYVGVGDTLAATRLVTLFTRSGKAHQVRLATDLSFSDLRSSPAVIIGAFSNSWTIELMKEWRFTFEVPTKGRWLIRDRADPSRNWENPANRQQLRGRKITEDHALISRVFEQRSGQPVVSVAGLSGFGTGAAAEFLCDETLLASALKDAPKNWERKNLQIVIKVNVINSTAGKPEFVTRHFW